MLLTLKDIQELTQYGSPMTGYQMLRAASIEPADHRKVEGRVQPVNVYHEADVMLVFAERLAKIRKKSA